MQIDPSWQIVAAMVVGWVNGLMVGLVINRDRKRK